MAGTMIDLTVQQSLTQNLKACSQQIRTMKLCH